jgi:hypothetical protein
MTKHNGLAIALIGLVLGLIPAGNIAQAQEEDQNAGVSLTDSTPDPAGPNPTAASTATPQPLADSSGVSGPNAVESFLFDSLFMAGRTQDQFEPLTPKERLKVYAKDLFSPFHLMMAGASAGITQAQNVPTQWGQGARGYGRRYANYYAYALTSSALQMAGEDLLHEDNLYYGYGEHGIWKRVRYAVKSSVLARSADGTRHLSISQIGSTAGAAFISRLWQPPNNDSAGDGAVSFAISLATNAGVNVALEFLPDITRRIFHRGEQQSSGGIPSDAQQQLSAVHPKENHPVQ